MFVPSFSCLFYIGFEFCLFSFKPSSVPFYLSCLLSDSPLTFSGLFWNIWFRGINIYCIFKCFWNLNSLELRHRWNCNWNSYLSLSAFYQIVYPFLDLNLFSSITYEIALSISDDSFVLRSKTMHQNDSVSFESYIQSTKL